MEITSLLEISGTSTVCLDKKRNMTGTEWKKKDIKDGAFPVLLFLSSPFKNPLFQPHELNVSNVLRSAWGLCCSSFPLFVHCTEVRFISALILPLLGEQVNSAEDFPTIQEQIRCPEPFLEDGHLSALLFTLGGQASAAWPNSTFQHFPHRHNPPETFPKTLSVHTLWEAGRYIGLLP